MDKQIMEGQKLTLTSLAEDTLKGLSSDPKYLLAKYFYDEHGSRIFQKIMEMPEYYLTNCEYEIFSEQSSAICDSLEMDDFFSLIELGSGDGKKTRILLKQLVDNDIPFQYMPIDISLEANQQLVASISAELPGLNVDSRTGDYFKKLEKLNGDASSRKVILFLGSNIGNFSNQETSEFFNRLSAITHTGDKLLIGFDLKKAPQTIMDAYNDASGHTRRFNLNHLERLNRELDANFDTGLFEHHASYDPVTGEVKSFLLSVQEQEIYIPAIDAHFTFKQWEPIFMERSRKFNLETIDALANKYAFKMIRNFTDRRGYYADSLWEKQ